MLPNFINPAFFGPVLSLVGLVAKEAGKPGLAAVVSDPSVVEDIVSLVDTVATAVPKVVSIFGRLKASV